MSLLTPKRVKTSTSIQTIQKKSIPFKQKKLPKLDLESLKPPSKTEYIIDYNNCLKIGRFYKIHKASEKATKEDKIVKIYDTKKLEKMGEMKKLLKEIQILAALKTSKVVLNLEAVYNERNKYILVFEDFGSLLKFKDKRTRRDNILILSYVMLALLEINSFGFCILGFTDCSILTSQTQKSKIFNFDFFSKFDTKYENLGKLNEEYPMPESKEKIRLSSQSWAFGVLFLKLFFEKDNLCEIDWKYLSRGNLDSLEQILKNKKKFPEIYIKITLKFFESNYKKRKTLYELMCQDPFSSQFSDDYDLRDKMPQGLKARFKKSTTLTKIKSIEDMSDLSGEGDSFIENEYKKLPSITENYLRLPKSSNCIRKTSCESQNLSNKREINSFRSRTMRTISDIPQIPCGEINIMRSKVYLNSNTNKENKRKFERKETLRGKRRGKESIGESDLGKGRVWKAEGGGKGGVKDTGKCGFFGFFLKVLGCTECAQ